MTIHYLIKRVLLWYTELTNSICIYKDHKPLFGVFDKNKSLSNFLSLCMLRWRLFLSSYTYNLKYRPGMQLVNIDALSRLHLTNTVEDPPNTQTQQMFFQKQRILIMRQQILQK
ncbi:hypothetical protein PR048_005104 [Dryococelus australis]|uniref:Reverse transcriptase RNase H-like domain-containing protein n=1 Tax=Dryococelus australis TaxID=614101 RepID=A0ABQ9I9D7_9NEOP|nr:hypothetical protein PR048_005104 [Dryococelus australis]